MKIVTLRKLEPTSQLQPHGSGTVQHQMTLYRQQFRALSYPRIMQLKRNARGFIRDNPGCADNSNFWRGMSARHILES